MTFQGFKHKITLFPNTVLQQPYAGPLELDTVCAFVWWNRHVQWRFRHVNSAACWCSRWLARCMTMTAVNAVCAWWHIGACHRSSCSQRRNFVCTTLYAECIDRHAFWLHFYVRISEADVECTVQRWTPLPGMTCDRVSLLHRISAVKCMFPLENNRCKNRKDRIHQLDYLVNST